MSEWDRFSKAAWEVELPMEEKLVLLALAQHACAHCGLAWPGVPTLQRKTGMGLNKLRAVLGRLVAREGGLLRVHAYGRGGRACSTAYVLLEGILPASQAPCDKCAGNLAHPGRAGHARKPGAAQATPDVPAPKPTHRAVGNAAGNPPTGGTVSAAAGRNTHLGLVAGNGTQPAAARGDTPAPGEARNTHLPGGYANTAQVAEGCAVTGAPAAREGGQPSVEQEPSRTQGSGRRSDGATPRALSDLRPQSVAEVLRGMFPGMQVGLSLEAISHPDRPGADREEAQGRGQDEPIALAEAEGA